MSNNKIIDEIRLADTFAEMRLACTELQDMIEEFRWKNKKYQFSDFQKERLK